MGVAITDELPFVDEQTASTRRLGRVDLNVPVHLRSHDEGWVPGVMRNLCIGGMFLATPRALPIGARVVVRLSILDGVEPEEIEARVCWARRDGTDEATPAGLGLQFAAPMVHAAIFVRVLLRSHKPSWV
ncbi:MAG TPA: PilZ domain-containing protein [Polyangia bacterium]